MLFYDPSTPSLDTQDPLYIVAEAIEDLATSLPASARIEFAAALDSARTIAQAQALCARYENAYWFRRDTLRFWITPAGAHLLNANGVVK